MNKKLIAWTVLAGVVGVLVGIAIAYSVAMTGYRYANAVRYMADASTSLAILEKMSTGNLSGAKAVALINLKAAMMGLEFGGEDLSPAQQVAAEKIKQRAAEFLASAN